MKIKNLFLALFLMPATIFCKSKHSLRSGDKAPSFSLADETGKMRTLQEFKGQKVVLFFYPKDGTPGCTAEACGLRDAFATYKKNNIVLLGVSYDSVESHAKFQREHHLPFSLLSDKKGKAAKAYGANRFWLWNFAPKRKTILIDEQGLIVTVMNDVDVQEHSDAILKSFGVTTQAEKN